jgi:hypothetical protein
MVRGITSAWGFPISASGWNSLLKGDHPLTYEQSLTSYPPTFPNGQFQSPLSFGKRKRVPKKVCKMFLKNKSVNPLTGRKIKRSGKTFKMLMQDCEYHGLAKKKKLQKKN